MNIHLKVFVALLLAPLAANSGETAKPVAAMKAPDKLVVLTFDDGVASHATIVAPLLKKYGFGGTFFITEAFDFATNKVDYMTWEQIKGLHDAGFEIGNHTRQHAPVTGQMPADLLADVEFIEKQCAAHQIPRTTSFCYPVYAANAAAVEFLRGRGYRFARGGGGRGFDPAKDEPLLMPQAFDSKPGATFEQFVAAVGTARDGKIAVLTFHGVPDKQHPWVSTEPAVFEKYLNYLKSQGCTVIAARDMANTLEQRFDSPVTLVNLGAAGAGAGLGLTQIDRIKAENADLVTIAFGMNHTEPGVNFEITMRKLMVAVQAAVPNADIILVSLMTQALQQGKVPEKFFAYRDALKNLVTTNVALADVTTPFTELLKRKEFSDLSGNNYNHPNDFTHRLYAQVICQLFNSAQRTSE
jgi:peptidoglycan/xylan/chitin deacetylase (PgdA/CDA1 family)